MGGAAVAVARRAVVAGLTVLATVAAVPGAPAGLSHLADRLRAPSSDSADRCPVDVALPVPARNTVAGLAAGPVRYPVVVAVPAQGRGARTAEVDLALSGLPGQVVGTVEPARLTFSGAERGTSEHGTPATATATVTLRIAPGTAPGTSPFTVVARCGTATAHVAAALTVLPPRPRGGLDVGPGEIALAPGGTARACVSTGAATTRPRPPLTVTGGGAQVSADLEDRRPDGGPGRSGCAWLQVRVDDAAQPGDVRLTVAGGPPPDRSTGTLVVHVLGAEGLRFTATGAPPPGELAPGVTLPLDMAVTNTTRRPVRLTSLQVAVDHVDDAHAACPVASAYATSPFDDSVEVVVPAGATRSLSGAGVATAAWPQLSVLESGDDGSGCAGAVPSLVYTGTTAGL